MSNQEEIRQAWEDWEDQPGNSQEEWTKSNVSSVVQKYNFSANCKKAITISYTTAGDVGSNYTEYINQGGKPEDIPRGNDAGSANAGAVGAFANTDAGREAADRMVMEAHFSNYVRNLCSAPLADRGEANIGEILDYEYESARAQATYEQTVANSLKDKGADTAQDIYQCALDYSSSANILSKLIDEFWVEAANFLYNGSVPDGVRYQGGGGGHYSTEPGFVDALGNTGEKLRHFVDDGTLSVDHYAVVVAAQSRGGSGTDVAPEPANWDHIVVAKSSDLKSPETITGTSTDLKVDGGPETVIDNSNIGAFPLYYASLAAAYVNQAQWVTENAPSEEQIKAIEQGAPNAVTNVANSNHGGAANRDQNFPEDTREERAYAAARNGVYDQETSAGYAKPQGAFEDGDVWFAAKNSVESWAYTHADQDLGEANLQLSLTPAQFTIEKTYEYAMAAAEKLTEFYGESGNARETQVWLTERLGAIKSLVDMADTATNCIKNKYDNMLNKLDKANEDFVEALDSEGMWLTGWFKNKSLNDALSSAVDTSGIDIGAAVGGGAEKVIFRQQCFLLTYINRLAGYKKFTLESVSNSRSKCPKRYPYLPHRYLPENELPDAKQNACLQVDGDPYGFVNRLTQSPKYSKFFDIENWQVAGLQPRIRLFKVVYDDNNVEKEVELKFNSHFAPDEMAYYKDRKSRGAGVGLKSFEFTYDGSNPFAAKKSIKATLKLHASTFGELFESRPGKATGLNDAGENVPQGAVDYKYADLALKTLFKEKTGASRASKWDLILNENANLAQLNFRLKAVVGWSRPPGKLGGVTQDYQDRGGPTAKEIQAAAAESFVTLNLTPTVHNFEFDDQGKVVFTINYLAYVEDFFDDRTFNTFADPTGRISMAREIRRLKMKTFSKQCGDEYSEELEKLKQEYADEAAAEQKCSISTIIASLMEKDKVHYIQIPPNVLDSFVSYGPYSKDLMGFPNTNASQLVFNSKDTDTLLKNDIAVALQPASSGEGGFGAGARTDEEMQQLRGALAALSPNNTYVPFFYVSDLIDIILINIGKELEYLSTKLKSIPIAVRTKIDQGDLAQRITEIQKFKTNFKRLRVTLGPVELKKLGGVQEEPGERAAAAEGISTTTNRTTNFVNFGDLPISVSYFVEFLAEKVLRRENDYYSLTRMLNDFFNNLIDKFLNSKSCFAFDISQKVRVNQNVLTSYAIGKGKYDTLTLLMAQKEAKLKNGSYGKGKNSPARLHLRDSVVKSWMDRDGGRPILNISGYAGQEGSTYAPLSHEINYLTFFAARTRPADRMTGSKAEDLQGGIFHYLLGRNKGIVKNIKLTKTQTPGLQEVRFEQEGYDGLEQLRVVYDVEIDCMANVNSFPGTYIYIPPRGFDPSVGIDMTKFGIGGYYMIYRSTHTFASGEAGTKIYAKWVAQLAVESEDQAASRIEDSISPGKCGIRSALNE